MTEGVGIGSRRNPGREPALAAGVPPGNGVFQSFQPGSMRSPPPSAEALARTRHWERHNRMATPVPRMCCTCSAASIAGPAPCARQQYPP